MAEVKIQCCDLCGKPLQHFDGRTGATANHNRKEALLLVVGFSRGGWGRRRTPLDFSGEVCGECFDAAEPLLRAVRDFVRDRKGWDRDPSPVWEDQPSPKGRGASLRGMLRALPARSGHG